MSERFGHTPHYRGTNYYDTVSLLHSLKAIVGNNLTVEQFTSFCKIVAKWDMASIANELGRPAWWHKARESVLLLDKILREVSLS